MGKYTVFCRKSGATWEIFVANQGQVGKFLLQIRGKWIFLRGLFFVVHGFQPEGETAAFVDFRFHGEASAEAFGDNTAY